MRPHVGLVRVVLVDDASGARTWPCRGTYELQFASVHVSRDAVGDLDSALVRHEQVAWLDVAVHELELVQVVEPAFGRSGGQTGKTNAVMSAELSLRTAESGRWPGQRKMGMMRPEKMRDRDRPMQKGLHKGRLGEVRHARREGSCKKFAAGNDGGNRRGEQHGAGALRTRWLCARALAGRGAPVGRRPLWSAAMSWGRELGGLQPGRVEWRPGSPDVRGFAGLDGRVPSRKDVVPSVTTAVRHLEHGVPPLSSQRPARLQGHGP
jgi:hypothetical protein